MNIPAQAIINLLIYNATPVIPKPRQLLAARSYPTGKTWSSVHLITFINQFFYPPARFLRAAAGYRHRYPKTVLPACLRNRNLQL